MCCSHEQTRPDDVGILLWHLHRARERVVGLKLRQRPGMIIIHAAPHPAGLATVHGPLDDVEDTAFWEYCWANDLAGSPLYYQPFLDRKAERCAAVLAAIAKADLGSGAPARYSSLDATTYLRAGGLSDTDLSALRARLLAPIGTAPDMDSQKGPAA